MRWAAWQRSGWTRTSAGVLATLLTVSLPMEITIRLAEQPIVAPPRAVTLLTVASCLLLVGSGICLRRIEAARDRRPTLGA